MILLLNEISCACKLYEMRHFSLGRAAESAGLRRVSFLEKFSADTAYLQDFNMMPDPMPVIMPAARALRIISLIDNAGNGQSNTIEKMTMPARP